MTTLQELRRRCPRPAFPARPALLDGVARVLDFGGALNQYDAGHFELLYAELRARRLARKTGPEAEAEALHRCWMAAGDSLRFAMGKPEAPAPDFAALREQPDEPAS